MSLCIGRVPSQCFLDLASLTVSLPNLRLLMQVVNLCASAHEIWSLPLQIVVALGLMWTQVRSKRVYRQ